MPYFAQVCFRFVHKVIKRKRGLQRSYQHFYVHDVHCLRAARITINRFYKAIKGALKTFVSFNKSIEVENSCNI